jgi:hypothetical protein
LLTSTSYSTTSYTKKQHKEMYFHPPVGHVEPACHEGAVAVAHHTNLWNLLEVQDVDHVAREHVNIGDRGTAIKNAATARSDYM